ncbi:hypothetical protein [Vibrio nomapromontoriensis]|uniref:hypothetical protein n=1 Tax=Vibrio nomapromontoriensis TaxID=2910246 RepID=UPI003D1346DF
MNNKVKFLFIALALGAGFLLPNLLNKAKTMHVDLSEYCMLSTKLCEQDGVKIQLNKDRAHPLLPVEIQVFWPDAEAEQLLVSLQGKEMDMGVVKYQLEMNKPNVYQGEIVLPVCTEDSMTWYGTIAEGENSVQAAIRMTR